MSLVLTFCWREWRAQRGMLTAYTAMGLASLAIVFLGLPEHWWLEDGRCALALSWFVVLGAVGVIAFAAPTLVRGEYAQKGDQFVKRLPGALLPSFGGKLLFLVLCAAALPLVCLLAGEGFLLAIGRPWHDLYRWTFAGDVELCWPWATPLLGYAALLTTWVWALGCWLPNGRMALGATILFVLAIGGSVVLVLRQSPGIENGIAWRSWLWLVPVLGTAVAAASWTLGRRGGNAWRSARVGGAVAAIGLAPPGAWLAARAHDYHHPDPQRLAGFRTVGVTPDLRWALVQGAAHEHFAPLPFRVDLRDGSAVQLGGAGTSLISEHLRPGQLRPWDCARYWSVLTWSPWAGRVGTHHVLDLTTLAVVARSDAPTLEAMRDDVAARIAPLLANEAPPVDLRAPGAVTVRFEGHELVFVQPSGRVERVRWEGDLPLAVTAAGHGFCAHGARGTQLFDLTTRRVVTAASNRGALDAWLVRGVQLHGRQLHVGWWRRNAGEDASVEVGDLKGARILGLLDDDRLLCQDHASRGGALFPWHVASGRCAAIELPAGCAGAVWSAEVPLAQAGSLLPRDPAGLVWMTSLATAVPMLRLDPATLSVAPLAWRPGGGCQLLAWIDAATALVHDGRAIRRVDVSTGAATQVFPRDGGAR